MRNMQERVLAILCLAIFLQHREFYVQGQVEQWGKATVSGDGPSERFEHSKVTFAERGEVFLFGGQDTIHAFAEMWKFTFFGSFWSEVHKGVHQSGAIPGTNLPNPRHGHCAVRNSTNVVVFGGGFLVGKAENFALFNDVWSFNIDTNIWSKVATSGASIDQRFNHACSSASSIMYIFGGDTAKGISDKLYSFNMVTGLFQDISPTVAGPGPLTGASATWFAPTQHLVIFGGMNDENKPTAETWEYDPNSRTWSPILVLTALPPARGFHGTTLSGSKLYVLGGEGPSGSGRGKTLSDFWMLDLFGKGWTQLPPKGNVPTVSRMTLASDLPNILVAFGGQTKSMSAAGFTYTFDITTAVWKRLRVAGETPSHRAGAYGALLTETSGTSTRFVKYAFGGQSAVGYSNDTWLLDLTTKEWHEIVIHGSPKLPEARGYGCAQAFLRDMVIFGGKDSSNVYNDVWRYQSTLSRWEQLQPPGNTAMPSARSHMSCALSSTVLAVFGGINSQNQLLNDVWTLDLGQPARSDAVASKDMMLEFDGQDDFFVVHDTSLQLALTDYSVEAWVRIRDTNPGAQTLLFEIQTIEQHFPALRVYIDDGKVVASDTSWETCVPQGPAEVCSVLTATQTPGQGRSLADSSWHHVTVTVATDPERTVARSNDSPLLTVYKDVGCTQDPIQVRSGTDFCNSTSTSNDAPTFTDGTPLAGNVACVKWSAPAPGEQPVQFLAASGCFSLDHNLISPVAAPFGSMGTQQAFNNANIRAKIQGIGLKVDGPPSVRPSRRNITIYVDGEISAHSTVVQSYDAEVSNPTVTINMLAITMHPDYKNIDDQGFGPSKGAGFFNGEMDNIALWTKAFSDSEVVARQFSVPNSADTDLSMFFNMDGSSVFLTTVHSVSTSFPGITGLLGGNIRSRAPSVLFSSRPTGKSGQVSTKIKQWSQLSFVNVDIPSPRWSTLGGLTGNGRMLILGGYGNIEKSAILSDLWELDFIQSQWRSLASPNISGIAAGGSFVNKGYELIVMGGDTGIASPTPMTLRRYQFRRGTVTETQITDLLSVTDNVLVGNSSSVVSSFGKVGVNSFQGGTVSFGLSTGDVNTLQPGGSSPPGRYWPQVAAVGDSAVYLFGGLEPEARGNNFGATLLGDLWKFGLPTYSWSVVEPTGAAPPPLGFHSMTSVEIPGKTLPVLVVLGGFKDFDETPSGPSPKSDTLNEDMYIFDPNSNTWTKFSDPAPGTDVWLTSRAQAAVSSTTLRIGSKLGSFLFVHGGYAKEGGNTLYRTDLWVIPITDCVGGASCTFSSFESEGENLRERFDHGMIAVNDGGEPFLVVFGGTIGDTGVSSGDLFLGELRLVGQTQAYWSNITITNSAAEKEQLTRQSVSVVEFDSKLILFGGERTQKQSPPPGSPPGEPDRVTRNEFNDMWYLSLEDISDAQVSRAWKSVKVPGSKPDARSTAGSFVDKASNTFWIFGGFTQSGGSPTGFSDLHSFPLTAVFPESCVASGSGLSGATAGVESTFVISAADVFGDAAINAASDFRVSISGPVSVGPSVFEADPEDAEAISADQSIGKGGPSGGPGFTAQSALYRVSYRPVVIGSYTIQIYARGPHLIGTTASASTFTIKVQPGVTHPQSCTFTGPSITVATAGIPSTMTIISNDRFGNRRSGGDLITASIQNTTIGTLTTADVTDNSDGTYSVFYRATVAGLYNTRIVIGSSDISGSPSRSVVYPDSADTARTVAFGAGLSQGRAGSVSTIFVQTRDRYDNFITADNQAIDAQLVRTDGTQVTSLGKTITYRNLGLYRVSLYFFSGESGLSLILSHNAATVTLYDFNRPAITTSSQIGDSHSVQSRADNLHFASEATRQVAPLAYAVHNTVSNATQVALSVTEVFKSPSTSTATRLLVMVPLLCAAVGAVLEIIPSIIFALIRRRKAKKSFSSGDAESKADDKCVLNQDEVDRAAWYLDLLCRRGDITVARKQEIEGRLGHNDEAAVSACRNFETSLQLLKRDLDMADSGKFAPLTRPGSQDWHATATVQTHTSGNTLSHDRAQGQQPPASSAMVEQRRQQLDTSAASAKISTSSSGQTSDQPGQLAALGQQCIVM